MEGIKPCPFCGCESIGSVEIKKAVAGEFSMYFVECQDCQARGPFSSTKEIAIAAWNQRAVRPVMCESCKRKVNECNAEYKIVCASYEEKY